MTYVLFHSRFQLSSPQRLPMAAIIEKKKARRGRWEERKGGGGGGGGEGGEGGGGGGGGGGGAEASLPLFLLPIVPHALFFFSFSLSSPHPTLRAFQFLQPEKQSTVNDKWRTFFIVSYASVMTPCDGITLVSAVV